MSKATTAGGPLPVLSSEELGPACDTCGGTGQYEGESQWYVCVDCDVALISKVKLRTGAPRGMYTQMEMDAAVAAERERCAMKLQVTRSDVQLAAGELRAEEWRTCAAVLQWMQRRIRGACRGIEAPDTALLAVRLPRDVSLFPKRETVSLVCSSKVERPLYKGLTGARYHPHQPQPWRDAP